MRGSGKFGKARIIPAKSEQSALRERDRLVACDDEMVEHLDLDQRQGLLQVAREELVGLAGLRHAGRMVVGKDDCRGIDAQRRLDDLARVPAGFLALKTARAKPNSLRSSRGMSFSRRLRSRPLFVDPGRKYAATLASSQTMSLT